MITEASIKSKARVRDHGEVFTPDFIVHDMLDLVEQETKRIDSRFLEPACGNGNFLAEVLRRKLAVVKNRYKKSQFDYERYALIAVSSMYGIDILIDNVQECQARLLKVFDEEYTELFKKKCNKKCLQSAKYILEKNIILGDALTLKSVDGENPIVFAEWSTINGTMMKRRDYTLANLLDNQPINEPNLFSDMGDKAFIPIPIAEFPPVHFLEISTAYEQ